MKTDYFLKLVIIGLFSASMIEYVHGSDYSSITTILNHYKNEIVTIKDLDAEVKEAFLNVEQRRNPGIVIADFDGDGKEDVALLTKEQKSNALTLRFFLCKKRCKGVKSIDLGVFYGIQLITPIKKGEVVEPTKSLPAPPGIKPVRLSNTAVHFGVYGKTSIAYFWEKEKQDFVSIATSD